MNRYISLFLFLLSILPLGAQSKISPYSRAVLHSLSQDGLSNHAPGIKSINECSSTLIPAFITIDTDAPKAVENLKCMGIEVQSLSGNIVTALIPIGRFEESSALKGVKNISIARKLHPCNDKARELSNITQIANATSLSHPYTGKDVIIGIVDTGIDFNHINFKDQDGVSRVSRVYLPHVTTGNKPLIGGYTLQGSEYNTPEQISTLTTDYTLESHGTHTTGTAGGSYSANGYQGAAPGCELVLCGLDSILYDTDIINSVAYVFNYAKSVNKPAVVSLSLSSHQGAHDGSSAMCRALDNLASDGNIIVLAASNDAQSTLYLHKKFTADDNKLSTIIFNNYTQEPAHYKNSLIDTWSRDNKPVGVQFNVIAFAADAQAGIKMGDVLASSPTFFPRTEADSIFTWSSDNDINLAKYFTGKIDVAAGIDTSNGKFDLLTAIDMLPTKFRSYLLTYTVIGEEGTECDTWEVDTRLHFGSFGLPGYVSGTGDISISDMATGFNTISVGAYVSRAYYTTLSGATLSLYGDKVQEKDIALFSSYGIDLNGIAHPDVVAPGSTVISSFNSYDTSATPQNSGCYRLSATDSSREYIWGADSGTSMSTPLVAGSIALWLEANPKLSPADIKEIIRLTAYQDSFTTTGNPVKWGAGKFDAYNGLLHVLSSTGMSETPVNASMRVYPSPSDGNFTVLMPHIASKVKIDILRVDGSLVYSEEAISENHASFQINASNYLSAGIYILRVTSHSQIYSSLILIRK